MRLGAMNGLPSKPTSGVRARAVILLRRCLSSALSALNTFFTTYLGLEDSSGSRRTEVFSALRASGRPSPFHLSPFTFHPHSPGTPRAIPTAREVLVRTGALPVTGVPRS